MSSAEQAATAEDAETARVLVWDWPTRLVHWLIVGSFALSWWSAENREMEWHYRAGMAMLLLVLFRLIWGFIGSKPSRFVSFVRGPSRVLDYARTLRHRDHHVVAGHNPLGGWSVVALLTTLLVQVTLGLFAVDIDGIESGPLSWLVEFDTGRRAAEIHALIFDVLLALAALHIAAVLFYLLYKRENLMSAMVGGYKRMRAPPAETVEPAHPVALIIALVIAGVVTWQVWSGLPFLA